MSSEELERLRAELAEVLKTATGLAEDRAEVLVELEDLRAELSALKAANERARRMAQVWIDIRPTHPTASDAGHGVAYAGQQILDTLAIPETPGGES